MQFFTQYFWILIMGLIIVETLLTVGHDLHEQQMKDIISSSLVGMLIIVINLIFKGVILFTLVKLQSFAPVHLQNHWWVWILLFILSDLSHYGFHYIEHKCRFFWAAHVMHHSSQYYNFSVSVRTPVASSFYRLLIQAPLCLAGFDPAMIVIVESFILIYAFFLHTEHVKKMGWIEIIFNTPSHHRVHHGSNKKYLDKNFGTVLIVWDKLFGTFQPEDEKACYGLTTPLNSTNPVVIMSHEWIAMTKDVAHAASWKDALSYIFSYPGWQPMGNKRLKNCDGDKPVKNCIKADRSNPGTAFYL